MIDDALITLEDGMNETMDDDMGDNDMMDNESES